MESKKIEKNKYADEINIIKESNLFDSDFYLKNYPSVKDKCNDPIEHYVKFGWKEGKNPGENFDTSIYLTQNEDVKNAGINPLIHYIKYGRNERRLATKIEYINSFKNLYKKYGYLLKLKDNRIFIEGKDIKIIGNSINTLWTGQGVLCSKEYDFYSEHDFVMIDIGLNIGITALSMARYDNIKKVYGFEPFKSTFEQAQINLSLNPKLAKKIRIFNFGLGNKEKKIKINYNPILPGAMSSVRNIHDDSLELEEIDIKQSSEVLKDIFKQNQQIFLKIDCEGAEEEIIENLHQAGLLKKVKIICMEWHFKNPVNLIKILLENEFVVFNTDINENKLGFIRAVKS